jgi:cell wall-associated NlpC family hydrolase
MQTHSSSRLAATALRFQGQRYDWGGGHSRRTGLQPVDCSGLVIQAARLCGLHLAEGRARDLQRRGTPVSLRHLRPGDLVFKGHPATHVGIYLGGGRVLHSPGRGKRVTQTGMHGWTSARRVESGRTWRA